MLDQHLNNIIGLFLVLVNDDDGLVVVRNRFHGDQCTVLRQLDGREERLDLLLHLIDVHVTHNDQRLVVRTVPLLVVSLQEGTLEVVDDFHQTDGHAMTVFRVGVQLRQVALQHTLRGTGTQAPLFVDDATLLLYLLLFQQQTVSPVIENQQTGVDDALTGRRNITYIIHRLVNAGVGIQVRSELHADALTPAQQLVALEVLAAVESHVLQEVGQSALVVILLDGAHTLGDVELCTLLRPGMVADVVGQSVIQFANADVRIYRNVRHLLCHHRYHAKQHECCCY